MGTRKLSFGDIDVVVFFPGDFGRRLSILGGFLPRRSRSSAEHLAPMAQQAMTPETAELLARVDAIEWYHTIDLGNGIATPGWFDLRDQVHRYPIPARLDGMRVLDVATFDGFWAFEFAKRGAAEVVAMDIDSFAEVDMSPGTHRRKSPEYLARKTGEGFRLCQEVLNLPVRREVCNVYDLSPERMGMFDIVFVSDLLLHLMNPMKALHNIASVTRGEAIVADVYDAGLPETDTLMRYLGGEVHNTWWSMSFGALRKMICDAGFSSVELTNRFMLGYRDQAAILPHATFRAKP
jgi:tRNA (mo5U34)-methyltransferase